MKEMNQTLLWLSAQVVRIRTLLAYQKSWRQIPIKEGNEKLVLVPKESSYPFYAREMKMTDDEDIYLRESVLSIFLYAKNRIRDIGYDLKVYDGWRSLELQENLFWHYMKQFIAPRFSQLEKRFSQAVKPMEIKSVFLELSPTYQETLREATRTYVSWPSADPKSPSPHTTGGAVDVWLYKDDRPVSLGIPFDWMEESAGAFYHLKFRREKFPGDKSVCFHRNLLIYIMTRAGFSCYGPEIWHFNYGNQMHSLVTGKTSCYSFVEP